jgi:hypothetical protein
MDTTSTLPDGSYNVDLYFTRSIDGGQTWSTPRVLNGDGDLPGDQFFPWIEVDKQGRLHVLYFDTRRNPQPDDAPLIYIDAYYALSSDRGETWQEHRLTPQPYTYGSGFIGDYLGLAAAGDRVYAAYPYATIGTDLDLYVSTVVVTPAGAGDLNCDGAVDAFDIDPFVRALTDPAGYAAAYPHCAVGLADVNDDGAVDAFDIDPFVALLTGP